MPEAIQPVEHSMLIVPNHFPDLEFPEENTFTNARWELGKKLFFDPIMSRDSSLSCASCHLPELAFSHDVAISPGVDGVLGFRNSPTLANVGYLPYFMREGGVPTLEMQIAVPVQEHAELDFSIPEIVDRTLLVPEYVAMADEAYGREFDAWVLTRAIATFERSLVSGNSPYDQYANGDLSALSPVERAGMELFFSDETHCSSCHSGFNLTGSGLENNGLYALYPDSGRYRLTGDPEDIGVFKVPTLRNVEVTAPYMHDGSKPDLMSVLEHYNEGGQQHFNQSDLIEPLGLTEDQLNQLEAFLLSLTDTQFLTDDRFIP